MEDFATTTVKTTVLLHG